MTIFFIRDIFILYSTIRKTKTNFRDAKADFTDGDQSLNPCLTQKPLEVQQTMPLLQEQLGRHRPKYVYTYRGAP